ncbi:MAG: sulfide-dependent adenosine diphosphate thiazole synthase [Candidatus Omnitrophica bacterium]|nr:sulfide-dependent adenosine diphosphate thiazole synthase [Candidatus Omnitrophota bacterium]
MLNEVIISEAIIDSYQKKLKENLSVDVAIAGAGPAGLIAAYYLAKAGKRTVLFEKKLSIGGGMWAGGMMFNEIVIQKSAKKILDEIGVEAKLYKKDYYLADAVQTVCSLGYLATKAGATILNGIYAEDIMVKKGRVCGLVINWAAANAAKLHVDPLTIEAKVVIDATGHPTEVTKVVETKSGLQLKTKTKKVLGEKSMWAEKAENTVEKNTKEVCPGLFVAGMAANAVFGSPRMGPIFGGMLLSGKKAAKLIAKKIK